MLGFAEELCKNESPEDLDKIKVKVYGTLNTTGRFFIYFILF